MCDNDMEQEAIKTDLKPFPKWEVVLYFTVYLSYLVYGLNELLVVRDRIIEVAKYDFSSGWYLLNKTRDDSNNEFENFTNFIQNNWLWYVLHIIVSMMLRKGLIRRQGFVYAALTSVFLLTVFSIISVTFVITMLSSYYAISNKKSKQLVWVISGVWLLGIHAIKNSHFVYSILDYTEFNMLVILLSWMMLRCSSFLLNKINDTTNKNDLMTEAPRHELYFKRFEQMYTLEHFLGYSLYFPTFIHGPVFGFHRYITVQKNDSRSCSLKMWCLCKELFCVFSWWFATYLALHFIFIYYMEQDIDAVRLIENPFTQYAVVYFMGQFFFMLYVIMYGLGIAIARFDGLDPPERPKCVGRIHFYSDMWKFFDAGLYEFLFHHIYAELCRKNSSVAIKLFATTATFAFIFLWHGCDEYVFIWSILNLLCLVAEKFLRWITSTKKYYTLVTLKMGSRNSQRLFAVLATQIFIPAAYSNVYFISSGPAGHLLMSGAYCSGFSNYLRLSFCSYCFFQCSEIILQPQNASKIKVKKTET